MLAHLAEVPDELGVAGDEAGPQAGHVRALRERVHREHAVEAGVQHRGRVGRRAVGVVGELGVALVARDDDAALARPGDDRGDASRPIVAPVGLPGSLSHSSEAALGVGGRDAVEIGMPVGVERHGHRAQAREAGAHLVGRVRDRRDTARCRASGCAGASTCGSDATSSFVPTHAITPSASTVDAEAAADPRRRGLAERGRADRRRVAGRRVERGDERAPRDVGHRVDRGADRAVDDATRASRRRGGGAR